MDADQTGTVDAHCTHGDLGAAILGAIRAAGMDSEALTADDLAPVDQFHTGGKAATLELARLAGVRAGQTVLDVGGGLGGPARTLAGEFGCAVSVVDLTAEYCHVGAMLTARTGLSQHVAFVNASALDLPFGDESFDVVWTQHSSMNIEDKDRLYAELRRVLRPGGRLALHEIMTGRRIPVRFPVTWATDQAFSFLRPPAAIRDLLFATGFAECTWEDVTDSTLAVIMEAKSSASPVAPSPLGLHLLLGDACGAMQHNLVCNLLERRVAVVRGVVERR